MERYARLGLINVAAANFHRNVMAGFEENDCDVIAFYNIRSKSNEKQAVSLINEDGIVFHYLNQVMRISKFWYILEKVYELRKNCYIVFDPLLLKETVIFLSLAKLFNLKTIAIVTDLPSFFYSKERRSIKDFLYSKIGGFVLNFFDYYVLISDSMSEIKRFRNKKRIVIEGFYKPETVNNHDSSKIRNFIYAGSIAKEYGIITLMKSFNRLKLENVELSIYSADKVYPEFLKETSEICKFYGYLDRVEIQKKLMEAHFLVNPRPSDLPYNKYSFPSKLLEYLGSGTPTITTYFDSIPKNISPFLNYFCGDTEDDFINDIQRFAEIEYSTLKNKASNAKDFINTNYSSKFQVESILKMLRSS